MQEPTTASRSSRKSGRPTRRGHRGRNQYTRDRDNNNNNHNINGGGRIESSPRGSQRYSHDVVDSPKPHHHGNGHVNAGGEIKPSRPRHMNPQRTTMNEMKRRVAAILEFISRMQVEMAATGSGGGGGGESSSTPTSNGNDHPRPPPPENGPTDSEAFIDDVIGQIPKEKDFRDLSSVEMMDVLTRHLLKWQQEYGKFGER